MADAAWVALSVIRGLGGKTLRALIDRFGAPDAILGASASDLRRVRGIGPALSAAITAVDLPEVERALARWQDRGVRIVASDDPEYPAALRTLDDAPPTLFIRGHWPCLTERAVAIVGTRTASPDALALAQRVAGDLAEQGVTVVSGLALGIDSAAHIGALATTRGVTAAVLGSGLLDIYPPQNAGLAAAIERRGALVCEIRPDSRVNTPALVARNRIISGLSQCVLVVQTDADGGALHAARAAIAQGRRVCFVDDPLGNADTGRGIDALRELGADPLPPGLSIDALLG
ncbi:MAG: DNA-protecting protein DprA [Chloroflexi bacterium]|nr:DNA-protecting protein DprA [Chloroflexota bacterium]